MTNSECQLYLSRATSWGDYYKRYDYLLRGIPNKLERAESWAQVESFPHLMFQLMHNYKGLWYR